MIGKLQYISKDTIKSSHLQSIEKVLIAGGKWIQLRVKNQDEVTVLKMALEAAKLCKNYGARLVINDYPEIALKTGAFGVHLGLEDMPISEARVILGDQAIIGGTANTFEQILQRVAEGANYIGLGPYRFTSTKQNLSPLIGLTGYKQILAQVDAAGIRTPIVAIGGILMEDLVQLQQAGIYGVAISAALTDSENPAELISRIHHILENK